METRIFPGDTSVASGSPSRSIRAELLTNFACEEIPAEEEDDPSHKDVIRLGMTEG